METLFPSYLEVREPLLAELARRGGRAKPSDEDASGRTIYTALADHFDLSNEARNFQIYEKNGAERSKWQNIVRWVRNDLKKAGLLSAPAFGVWELTEQARTALDEIDTELAASGGTRQGAEITPEEFEAKLEAARVIGLSGDEFVLEFERSRLASLGQRSLAEKIEHTATVNVAAGYDVRSFEADGTPRYIEVKATSTQSLSFEITANEWRQAQVNGTSYWVYRVTGIGHKPHITQFQDPWKMQQQGSLLAVASAYRISPAEKQKDA